MIKARLNNAVKTALDEEKKQQEKKQQEDSFDYEIGDTSFNTLENQVKKESKVNTKKFTKPKFKFNRNRKRMIKKSKKNNY